MFLGHRVRPVDGHMCMCVDAPSQEVHRDTDMAGLELGDQPRLDLVPDLALLLLNWISTMALSWRWSQMPV
jgi:hypothetical protein